MVEFKILGEMSKMNTRIIALDFRRQDFGLFRNLLGRITGITGRMPCRAKGARRAG